MARANERRRAHLEECLIELDRVRELVRDSVKNDKSVVGNWTAVNGLRAIIGAVETLCQLVALLPPEDEAAARIGQMSDGSGCLNRLLLAHSLGPHRTLGPPASQVRDALHKLQLACMDLESFLKGRLAAIP